jgi:hypothetical protein
MKPTKDLGGLGDLRGLVIFATPRPDVRRGGVLSNLVFDKNQVA